MRIVQLKKPYSTMRDKKSNWKLNTNSQLINHDDDGNSTTPYLYTSYSVYKKYRWGIFNWFSGWNICRSFENLEKAEEYILTNQRLEKLKKEQKSLTKYYE